jgi:Di-haem cytochrome c peroxidase
MRWTAAKSIRGVPSGYIMPLVCWFALFAAPVMAFPVGGSQTVLPAGTELNEDAPDRPREVFRSEVSGGRKSYLVNLGDVAFSSPAILGGVARQAGMSCSTCHVNGASNPKFYIPRLSTRPGNFITTGALFNAKANNRLLDPVTIPSLRGARFLAPYGHDGRTTSLRDFVHNVITNEFAGPEPSPAIVDAIVVYIQDIDFLPNPNLGPGGRLTIQAGDAARRGETLFARRFPHDPSLSCAGCHIPSAVFVDHLQHDVGSGGFFKTPTLLNANFNAPYFHDGRYDSYERVVEHFDHLFELGLTTQDRADLVAYLSAVGDGRQPYERDGVLLRLAEIMDFASVLSTAIPARDAAIIALVTETVGGELRELTEKFPAPKDTNVSGGREQRAAARAALKNLVLCLRRIDLAAAAGRFDEAANEYFDFRRRISAVPVALQNAEPWSLFDPAVHDAHYSALRQMYEVANGSSQ